MVEESHVAESIQLDNEAKINLSRTRAAEESFMFPAPAAATQPHVAAATPASIGIWAYVAGNTLVVAQPAPPPRKWPIFTLLDGSGWSKYTSVSMCQELRREDWPLVDCPLVTASDSGVVRIWNIKKSATIKYHEQHWGHSTVAEWSPRNSKLIYAMDVEGQLSIWDVRENSLSKMTFRPSAVSKIRASCIAVSPYEDGVVAVGTLDADVYILDATGVGAIMHKMRHAEQICSLFWKPTGVWSTVPTVRKFTEPYLASSAFSIKPPSIMIWDRAGKEVATLIPWALDTKDRKLNKIFLPAIWITHPKTNQIALVSRGTDGNVLIWAEAKNLNPQKLHSLNSHYIITGFLQSGEILWTFTEERVLIGWNLVKDELENIIPMFNGIASIQVCPTEHLVAIGGLDGMLRVVKMGAEYPDLDAKELELPVLSNQIKGRITALAWHPRTEKIAFGTSDGELGVFECKRDVRFTMIFDKRIAGTVYTVDWGAHTYPEGFVLREKKEDEDADRAESLWIYACGNRTVSMIHPGKKSSALVSTMRTIQLSNPGRPGGNDRHGNGVSEVKWSPDQLYCAFGYSDGKIEIYQAPYLKLRCWIKCHGSGIQYLSWRPHDFHGQDSAGKHYWFASCCNDATAKIFDLAKLYDPDFISDTSAEPEVIQKISSDGILIGHGGLRVISLAWSPHDDNLLLSTSYDRTAVVWDITKRTRVARYTGHEHRVVAGIFHPNDRFKVITSSDEMTQDSCLHIWDYRNHPESEDYVQGKGSESMAGEIVEAVKAQAAPIARVLPGGLGDGPAMVAENLPENVLLPEPEPEDLITRLAKGLSLFPLANPVVERNTFLDELKYIIDKTPIPVDLDEYSKQQVAEENSVPKVIDDETSILVKLLESNNTNKMTSNDGLNDPVLPLAVLGSGSDVERMIHAQVEDFIRKEDWRSVENLIGYVKDPKSLIVSLIKSKAVNRQGLLSAHKHSKRLFEDAALTYCSQLAGSDACQEACSILLLLDRVDEALEILIANHLFLDALTLAKCRELPSEVAREILVKWQQLQKDELDSEELVSKMNNVPMSGGGEPVPGQAPETLTV